MKGPGYAWTCRACDEANPSDALKCTHCGFPSVASATEIARAKGEAHPVREAYASLGKCVGKGLLWCCLILFPWW